MLYETLQSQGGWLFRWRSFLPLVLLAPMAVAMAGFQYLGQQHWLQEDWTLVCLAVATSGLAIRALTVGYVPGGTSGRNTRSQRADVLNTTGMYSLCRNPLYLGNLVIILGISMFFLTWWLLVIILLGFWLYYERIIIAEENFLREKFGVAYEQWTRSTPVFIPRLRGWRPPDLEFSFRAVLRREYSGFFLIIASFYVLELSEHLVLEHRLVLYQRWTWIFLAGLAIYLSLRTLKKQTSLLSVPGR